MRVRAWTTAAVAIGAWLVAAAAPAAAVEREAGSASCEEGEVAVVVAEAEGDVITHFDDGEQELEHRHGRPWENVAEGTDWDWGAQWRTTITWRQAVDWTVEARDIVDDHGNAWNADLRQAYAVCEAEVFDRDPHEDAEFIDGGSIACPDGEHAFVYSVGGFDVVHSHWTGSHEPLRTRWFYLEVGPPNGTFTPTWRQHVSWRVHAREPDHVERVGAMCEPAQRPPSGAFDGELFTTGRVGESLPSPTAVAISRDRFDRGEADHAVLARADKFADALAGSALTDDGPLLLTSHNYVRDQVADELRRVLDRGSRVYLLGGTAALSDRVADDLVDLGFEPRRLAGASRVETAVAIADEVRSRPASSDRVLVARSTAGAEPTSAWADSVTGGGAAAFGRIPLLLTQTDRLHDATSEALDRYQPQETVLLGGTAALSARIERAVPRPRRLAGSERAATASSIADELWDATLQPRQDLYRATIIPAYRHDGWKFGLPAAGLAADRHAPLLVGAENGVPRATEEWIGSRGGSLWVETGLVGGQTVFTNSVVEHLGAIFEE